MKWEEGQRVECEGLNWGSCYITMTNKNLVVVYCPQYEIVTTGSPEQLEKAGWRPLTPNKVIHMDEWARSHQRQKSPAPTS